MNTLKKICLITVLFAIGCQKKPTYTYQEFNKTQQQQFSKFLKTASVEAETETASYKNKKIYFSRQLINGNPVTDSFIKKINSDSELEFAQVKLLDVKKTDLKLNNPDLLKEEDIKIALKNYSSEFSKNEILKKEQTVRINKDTPVVETSVYVTDRIGTPYKAVFNSKNNLLTVERVGSDFSDISTSLYLDGPKLSSLSDVLLKSINIKPTLSNTLVFVDSESTTKISTVNSVLKFDPKDDRFDQIQAFYYINKAFIWMKENLQIVLPERIDAVVHLGFPDKTNSAFYFQNKIRLGQGDDVTYSNIAKDPTIVFHESFHAMIDGIARLPFQGEGGSLNEAFADFFTCLMTDRPYLAENSYIPAPFKRSVLNDSKLENKNGGLYHDSLIVSGLLWDIKVKLGIEKAKNLAVETLVRLNTASDFNSFSDTLKEAANLNLSADDKMAVLEIIKNRGF